MEEASRASGSSSFDLSMLGEAELAAMESLLSSAGDSDEPEVVNRLRDALVRARDNSCAEDSADALLGKALMGGGVSCKDGIELFEQGMRGGSRFFHVFAAVPEKPITPAALAKLSGRIQEAVAPGRTVAMEDAVAIVWATSSDKASEELGGRIRVASVIAGAACAVGAADPTRYFDLLSVCYDRARYAAGKARERGADVMAYGECAFEYLADKAELDDLFPYVRDVRALGLYESDRERGSDLLATAVTYMQCGFNLGQTAAAMHLHRRSVVYRLNRIAERSGIDLLGPYDGYDLLTLLLTCKLYRARLDDDAVPEEWTPSC